MSTPSIRELVAGLPEPHSSSSFSAARIFSGSNVHVARAYGGGVAVLLPVERLAPLSPDLRLANLSVTNRARCRIVESEGESVGEFGIVECRNADPGIQAVFLDVVEWLMPSEERISVEDVRRVLETLVELFATPTPTSRTSPLGLWGELWLMAQSAYREGMARAWHSDPRSRWDFAFGDVRIEVKTASGARAHHFSLEQLTPPDGIHVIVASIVTAEKADGLSLVDLVATVADSCEDRDVRARLIRTAVSSLGTSWAVERSSSFDEILAGATLRFLDADSTVWR